MVPIGQACKLKQDALLAVAIGLDGAVKARRAGSVLGNLITRRYADVYEGAVTRRYERKSPVCVGIHDGSAIGYRHAGDGLSTRGNETLYTDRPTAGWKQGGGGILGSGK
jgi:hypothetical protein